MMIMMVMIIDGEDDDDDMKEKEEGKRRKEKEKSRRDEKRINECLSLSRHLMNRVGARARGMGGWGGGNGIVT